MIHATFGGLAGDGVLDAFLSATRLDAARAFRVFRDTRRFELATEVDFIVRAPGQDVLARFSHPGHWAVSLEPKVSLTSLDGRHLRGERAAAPVEEYVEFFKRNDAVQVLARFSSPHLDAWARSGVDFPFIHTPLIRASSRQGVKVYDAGSAATALERALKQNFAGVAHLRGGAVLASEGDIRDVTELMLLVEQAAEVELLSELWTRPGRLERRREEERAPSWA